MKVHELLASINILDCPEDEVVVKVERGGSVARTPAIGVRSATLGFDWDQGKFLLTPIKPLLDVSFSDFEAINAFRGKQAGYMSYQHYKTQQARIKSLETELAAANNRLKG